VGSNVFFKQNFTKFEPEKCNFNLYKAFFMEKNDPNLPDFEGKKLIKSPDFYHKFQ
jgi:hypothetical protein